MPILGDKLFIYSPDKSQSITKVFISKVDENRLQFFGTFFGILEFKTQEKKYFDFLDFLTEEFESSYYDFSHANRNGIDIEYHFENCIKIFNAKLQRALTDNKLDKRIQDFNMAVGVIKNSRLYLSYCNDMYAFLFYKTLERGYKVADIFGNYKGVQAPPNTDIYNLFSVSINGKIKINDYLVLANTALLSHMPLDEIQKVVIQNDPEIGLDRIRNALWQASAQSTFACVALQNKSGVDTQLRPQSHDASQRSLNNLLRTEDATEKLLSMSLSPNIKRIVHAMNYSLKKTIGASLLIRRYINKEKISDGYAGFLSFLHKMADAVLTVSNVSKKLLQNLFKQLKRNNKTTHDLLTHKNPAMLRKIEQIETREPLNFNKLKNFDAHKRIAQKILHFFKSSKETMSSVLMGSLSKIKKIVTSLPSSLKEFFLKQDKRTLMKMGAGLLGTILLIFFIWGALGMASKKSSERAQQEYADMIKTLDEKFNEVEASLIYKDNANAQSSLNTANELLEKILVRSELDETTKEQILARKQKYQNTLDKIFTTEMKKVFDFSAIEGTPISLRASLKQNKLYFFASNQKTYFLDLNSQKIQEIPTTIQIEKVYSSARNTDKNATVFLHEKDTFTSIDATNNTLKSLAVTLNTTEKGINDINIYNNRLYTLVPSTNQIFRHSANSSGFGQGTPWLKDTSVNISDAKSITIDGLIYILKKTGEVIKVNNGAVQPYILEKSSIEINNANEIYTDENSTNLYITELEKKKIYVFGKAKGNFLGQYFFEIAKSPSQFIIDEPSKKIFIIDSESVYSVDMQHL